MEVFLVIPRPSLFHAAYSSYHTFLQGWHFPLGGRCEIGSDSCFDQWKAGWKELLWSIGVSVVWPCNLEQHAAGGHMTRGASTGLQILSICAVLVKVWLHVSPNKQLKWIFKAAANKRDLYWSNWRSESDIGPCDQIGEARCAGK